ncbi:MAG: DEAD/DEAH box helicase family protein [Bdellovibrionaceae bacterium]|nr:DEAD/DEAH box helicase family protein [Pseudobdellovibrionaceae bacterium]
MSNYKIDRDHLDSEDDEGLETENTNSPEEIKYLNRLHLDNINLEYKRTIEANNKNKYQFSKDVADRMPYPYQKLAIAQMKAKISSKFAEYGLVMPTGSGKTFTTSKYVCDKYINQGENVLVLAPSWEILSQHAETYCQSNKNFNNKIRILGRNNSLNAFEAYRRGERGKLVLSTPHTAINRINELEFSLLVVDEAHWGYARGLRMLPKIVEKAKRLNKPVLHMTATWNQSLQDAAKEPIFKLNYCDLSPDYLATCNIIRLNTGEKFEPQFCDKKKRTLNTKCISDISNRSVRVKKIVNKCHDAKYIKGKTMYYAGTIEEAFLAEKEFSNLGYKCGVVHSGWSSNKHKINTVLINRFRKENGLNILINVQMLTMGFDVKEIETIIVARPIQSDTLFMQICGRGARKIPGKKESFNIIDVHDVVVGDKTIRKMFEHRDVFMSKTSPPNGATPDSNKSDVTSIDQPIYNYSPKGSIKLIEETSLISLQGFPINDGQSFSFDFDVSWDNFGQSEDKDKRNANTLDEPFLTYSESK